MIGWSAALFILLSKYPNHMIIAEAVVKLTQLPLHHDSLLQQQMLCQPSALLSLVKTRSGTWNLLRTLLAPQMDDDSLNVA